MHVKMQNNQSTVKPIKSALAVMSLLISLATVCEVSAIPTMIKKTDIKEGTYPAMEVPYMKGDVATWMVYYFKPALCRQFVAGRQGIQQVVNFMHHNGCNDAQQFSGYLEPPDPNSVLYFVCPFKGEVEKTCEDGGGGGGGTFDGKWYLTAKPGLFALDDSTAPAYLDARGSDSHTFSLRPNPGLALLGSSTWVTSPAWPMAIPAGQSATLTLSAVQNPPAQNLAARYTVKAAYPGQKPYAVQYSNVDGRAVDATELFVAYIDINAGKSEAEEEDPGLFVGKDMVKYFTVELLPNSLPGGMIKLETCSADNIVFCDSEGNEYGNELQISVPIAAPPPPPLAFSGNTISGYFKGKEPGIYTITATYHTPVPPGKSYSDKVKVTVVKVEINGPGLTPEGLDSKAFSVTVIPANIEPAAYQWAASWPDGVGHTPGVNFDDPQGEETTVIKAQWYAQPDSRWASDTDYQCTYEITASVLIGGLKFSSEPINWIVRVIGGGATEPWPIWSGRHTLIIDQNQDDLWYVVGQGQFVRHDLNAVVYTTATSDFYNKVLAHENHHVEQFAEIEPWSNMWDVDQLYANVLSQLPGQDTREQMEMLVHQEIDQWDAQNFQEYNANHHEMEWQAYQKEYEVDPRYLEVQENQLF